jgi:putative endonuclease
MGAFVYMLQCADGSYYVGSARSDDLGGRIAEHEAGKHRGYTYTRRPVHLVWSERFDRITDAIATERQIKGWNRAKKEALVRGDWGELKRLARRRAGKRKSSSFEARYARTSR